MTSDKAKKIKAIVKGVAPKDTFGTNPKDPWSAKSNVTEGNDLERYLKSRGINPAFVSTDSKIAHSKSGEFAKWKRDHQFESWNQPDYEQSIKNRQAEADKKAKEQSKEGVNKLVTKYREVNKKEHHVKEEVDEKDTITLDIPFLIRVLEYAREDAKDDMALHRVVEKLIDIRNKGTLTMDDYDFVTKLKEDLDIDGTEQLDELDTNTLKRYAHKSMSQKMKIADKDPEQIWTKGSKFTKRSHGFSKAMDKIHSKEPYDTGRALKNVMKGWSKAGLNKEDLDIPVLENEEMWSQRVIDEGKMGDLAGEIGRHLDKHIDDYKANGGAEHLGHKTIDTAKKIVKSHGLHPDHAQKFVNDYVEKRLHEEIQTKVQKHFGGPKGKDYEVKVDFTTHSGERGSHTHTIKNAISGKHAKHIAMNRHSDMFGDKHKSFGTSSQGVKELSEDVYQDPQAATQTVFDGATNTDDTTQNRKKEMSKSARMIKALYKKHKMVKEDMYDHEKEDKSVATYGKKPKFNTPDQEKNFGENKPDAAATLSGGTTLTGEPRDTIEIDPLLQKKAVTPEGQVVSDKQLGKDTKKVNNK